MPQPPAGGAAGPRDARPVPALQRAAAPAAAAPQADGASLVHQELRRSGAPLPPDVRTDMEGRLGADFSGVRLHVGPQAAASAGAVRARAYTVGNHIVLGPQGLDTASAEGRLTLAHELAHVVQQQTGQVTGTPLTDSLSVSSPTDQYERAAQATARTALEPGHQGPPVGPRPSTGTSRTVQRVPTSTITFDEPEVVTGHVASIGPAEAGGTVATRCQSIATTYREAVRETGDNARTAIHMFAEYMHFPAEAEAEADLLGTATKFALKEGFKALWEWAVKPLEAVPGVDKVADLTLALVEECERAEQAGRRVRVRDWLVRQMGDIQTRFTRTIQELGDLAADFERGYAAAVREGDRPTSTGTATSTGTGVTAGVRQGDSTVSGPGAEYLNRIRTAAENGLAHVPTWESQLQTMIERWVRTREDTVESRGGGDVYMGGRIYLTVKVTKDGDDYTVQMPTTGLLAAPEADRTADAIHHLLTTTNRTVNDLAILKVLTVEVEDEVFGFNDTYHTVIHYRRPGRIEHRGVNFGPRVTAESLEKADRILPEAMRHFRISDISVRRLRSAASA